MVNKQTKSLISKQKLDKYFEITGRAITAAKKAGISAKRKGMKAEAEDFLDMAERYYSDAKHFMAKGDYVTAFAALNYAHGWLDAGARIGLFDVYDSELFTVD